jgi:hypothetical protein
MILFGLFLLYNYTLTGKISIATYPVIEREFRIVDPAATGFFHNVRSIASGYLENGVVYIPKLLGRYFLFPTGIFLPILAIFGAFKFKSKWKWVLICHFLMLIAFYNFHSGLGWPQYGARYYYPGFFSLGILGAFSLKYFLQMSGNKKYVLYALTLLVTINCTLAYIYIEQYSYRFKIRLALSQDARDACSEKNIIVFGERSGSDWKNNCLRKTNLVYVELRDIKRNFFLDTNQLFIENTQVKKLMGGRVTNNVSDHFRANFPEYTICFHYGSIYDKLKHYAN